jgi:hypothetical protein
MKEAICELESSSPLSFSRYIDPAMFPKKNKELPDDYEARIWMERAHHDEAGNIYIPGMMFKNCITGAAQYLSIQIPGKGKSTYSKNFKSGVLVLDPHIPINYHMKNVCGEWIFGSSTGDNAGRRVKKCFPVFPKWEATVVFTIVDSIITEDVFRAVLTQAGLLKGIGRFRPENGGFYGRFIVKSIQWVEND